VLNGTFNQDRSHHAYSIKTIEFWLLINYLKCKWNISLWRKCCYMSHDKWWEKNALDRGRTSRISLIYDPDLQSPVSYGHDLPKCKSLRSAVSRFQRQSGKLRNKRMKAIALPPTLMRTVKIRCWQKDSDNQRCLCQWLTQNCIQIHNNFLTCTTLCIQQLFML